MQALLKFSFEKKNGAAVGRGDELAGGDRLAIGERDEAGVLGAADALGLRDEMSVEGPAAGEHGGEIGIRLVQHPFRRCVRMPAPPGSQWLTEILHRVLVVIADERESLAVAARLAAEVDLDREHRLAPVSGLARHRQQVLVAEHAAPDERVAAIVDVADDRLGTPRHGKERRSPVDAQIVARLLQDRLVLGAKAEQQEVARLPPVPEHLLVRHVDRPLRGHVEVERDLVRRAVARPGAEPDIARRAREEFEIVGEQRAHEADLQVDRPRLEAIDRPRGLHLERGLPHALGERFRPAHEPQRLAVHPHCAEQRELRAGPVARPVIVEPIGERPAARVRIDRDQRDGRRTERGLHAGLPMRLAATAVTRLSG